MDAINLQQALFLEIKTKSPETQSLAEAVARLLDISTDSAYRRIRGEKAIQLDELYKLVKHFNISLDKLMDISTNGILFQGQYLDKKTFNFEDYMLSVYKNLAYMNSFREKIFYQSCKDLPIFHIFHFREIAAFKWFFWLKTYFDFPEFAKRKFKISDYPEELYNMDKKALQMYNLIPSVEIWNIESMNIIFRQIDFYRDLQVFDSDQEVYDLLEAIEKLWSHLEMQAALGYKFEYGDPHKKPLASFKMYFNEVLLGDNSMLLDMDGVKLSYLTHTTINFMTTRDIAYCDNLYRHLLNQMKRSTLISEVGEKERSRFFRIIRDRITARKENLKVS